MSLAEYLVPYKDSANICFDCQRACGKCSWTAYDPETDAIRFAPVPGWTAKPAVIYTSARCGKRYETATYHITACPQFVPDPPRRSDPRELSIDQLRRLLWMWLREAE